MSRKAGTSKTIRPGKDKDRHIRKYTEVLYDFRLLAVQHRPALRSSIGGILSLKGCLDNSGERLPRVTDSEMMTGIVAQYALVLPVAHAYPPQAEW